MYDLSLPIPLEHDRKMHALNYLNDAVQQYLDRYCGDSDDSDSFEDEEEEFDYDPHVRPKIFYPTPGQRRGPAPSLPAPAAIKGKRGISMTQAIQLALCVFLLFYLW